MTSLLLRSIRTTLPIRLLAVVTAALLGIAAIQTQPAHADEWCWNDPVVMIDGTVVSINVGAQGNAANVHGAVSLARVEITVPDNVRTQVLLVGTDPFREEVSFKRLNTANNHKAPTTVTVRVTFTASKNLAAKVHITFRGSDISVDGHTQGNAIETQFTLR